MDRTGIDGAAYACREFGKDDLLPWDNIDIGVSKDFLYREYTKAVEGAMTADCRTGCAACGLECKETAAEAPLDAPKQNSAEAVLTLPVEEKDSKLRPKVRVRTEFSKTGMLRYLSHLELVTALLRALRRAGVPHDFSKGFHPKPAVSFGSSLRVGVAGTREYFDMEVFTPFDVQLYSALLNSTLPDGIKVNAMQVIPMTEPSLTGFVSRYEYIVGYPASPYNSGDRETLLPIRHAPGDKIMVRRQDKEVDLSPCIELAERIEAADPAVRVMFGHDISWTYRLMLRDRDDIKVRPGEITEALFGIKMEDLAVIRTRLYGPQEGWPEGWKEPL
jgi:radical SAM-linked protein